MIKYCMKVAVCDDEPKALQSVTSMTREIAAQEGIDCELALYESSLALQQAIQNGAQYHTLLLDVLMDELGGMELAAALRRHGNKTAIVFFSNSREMALRGYEVSAVRYLAKPIEREKLSEALMFCYNAQQEINEILLPTTKGQRRIVIEKLMYAEVQDRGLRLTLTDGEINAAMKISELEAMLPEGQFIACHRSCIINLAFVQDIRRYELELNNGTCLLVSKYRYMDIKDKFFTFLKA